MSDRFSFLRGDIMKSMAIEFLSLYLKMVLGLIAAGVFLLVFAVFLLWPWMINPWLIIPWVIIFVFPGTFAFIIKLEKWLK